MMSLKIATVLMMCFAFACHPVDVRTVNKMNRPQSFIEIGRCKFCHGYTAKKRLFANAMQRRINLQSYYNQ